MLEHVDRIQIAVTDRAAAAQTFIDVFDAKMVKDDEVRALAARRRVVHAGTSEFELLEPSGAGPVQAYLDQWGEGLFAAGFSTNDVQALATRLGAKGVRFADEGGQLFIAPDQTPGLRMVISQEVARPMVGLMRYLYEATNLINDHASAAAFYADRFGLDASKFVPIKSRDYGYTGQLTMFNPAGASRSHRAVADHRRDEADGALHDAPRWRDAVHVLHRGGVGRPDLRAPRQEGDALRARRRERTQPRQHVPAPGDAARRADGLQPDERRMGVVGAAGAVRREGCAGALSPYSARQ